MIGGIRQRREPTSRSFAARASIATLAVLSFVVLLTNSGCTAVLDRSTAQCHTDNDCAHFGGHPYCQDSSGHPCQGAGNCVCAPSNLQPKNCVLSPPVNPDDFLNGCSFGALPGDKTSPLGECLTYSGPSNPDAGAKDPPVIPPAPPGDAGILVPLVACKDVAPGGSVLYMSGSSNFPPLLEKIAPAISKSLAAQNLPPITAVFKTTTSCGGVQSVYPVQPATSPPSYYPAHTIHNPTSATDSYPQYFDPVTSKLANCTLGPSGATVDIGESEIFAETCANPLVTGSPMMRNDVDVNETPGPKLAILFVVPAVSKQSVISSEAARELFGGGSLPPWTDSRLFYIRGAGTATQQLIGHAIGVLSNKFWGIDQGTAQGLALNLGSLVVPDVATQAIGILGADFYDENRGMLKALGFQATDQLCAYTPDSNSTLDVFPRDKLNVRDGHYPIWGPIHLFSIRVPGQASPVIDYFVNLFGTPKLPMEMLDAFIDASVVPDCAMMVQRDTELGPMMSALPVVSCGCHFDARVNPSPTPPHGCLPCSSNAACTDPKKPVCNYNFCEVQ